MIIIQLTGGLGNQLFQFAIGKSLSIRMNQRLLFDVSSFEWDSLRQFSLDKLLKQYEIATKEDIIKVKSSVPKFSDRLYYKFLRREIPYFKQSHIKELNFTFDLNFHFFSCTDLYLEGYWQSEKYFKGIRKEILSSLNLDDFPMSDVMKQYKQKISQTKNSVSMHIRRGDYVQNPETNAFHGICSLAYYDQAMKEIEKKIPEPTYFVFSDDKTYIKDIFGAKTNVEIIEGLHFDEEELLLMSLCKHQIIANSSFSWWGAWLNQNIEKIVIAPRNWFTNTLMRNQSQDLIPDNWSKI